MRTFSSEYRIATTSEDLPNVDAVRHGRSRPWDEGGLAGATEKGVCRHFIWRVCRRRNNWNTGGKRKDTFTSTGKETHSDWCYLDIFESHFLTCLNKPKLWTKPSLFKAGCSSWLLASIRRKSGGKKRTNTKLTLPARVQCDGSFYYKFTHPMLGGSNLISFKIKQLYSVTKMLLKIAFYYSFKVFFKNKCS